MSDIKTKAPEFIAAMRIDALPGGWRFRIKLHAPPMKSNTHADQ